MVLPPVAVPPAAAATGGGREIAATALALAAAVAAGDAVALARAVREALGGDAAAAAALLRAASASSGEGAALGATLGTAPVAAPAAAPAAEAGDGTDRETLLALPGVSLQAPRGRFDLLLSAAGVALRACGAKAGVGAAAAPAVPWGDLRHVLRVPKPDNYRKAGAPARAYYLVLPLSAPLQVGKQNYGCIVINADGVKPFPSAAALSLEAAAVRAGGALAARLAAALQRPAAEPTAAANRSEEASEPPSVAQLKRVFEAKAAAEPEHVTLSRLLAASLGVAAPEEPDIAICPCDWFRAYRGVDEGALYPLRTGLLFLPRPAIFVPAAEILGIATGRDGSVHCGATNTDVRVERTGTDGAGPTTEVFSNLPRGDVPLLLSSVAALSKAARGGVAAARAGGAAAAAAEGADGDDEDEEADVDYQTESDGEGAPKARPRRSLGASGSSSGAATRKRAAAGTPLGPAKRTRGALAAAGVPQVTLLDLDDVPPMVLDDDSEHDEDDDDSGISDIEGGTALGSALAAAAASSRGPDT